MELLGEGGEAQVFALDDERVLRVWRGAPRGQAERNRALLEQIDRAALPYAVPEYFELGVRDGHEYAIERRLRGRPLGKGELTDAYLAAAHALGGLGSWGDTYGDLALAEPLRTTTWREYLRERAERSLAEGGYAGVDAAALAAALPEPDAPGLVHLDFFPGNVLVDGSKVTAVLDFGPACVAGDARLNAVVAAAYLTGDDGVSWLADRGLAALLEPTRRWLAAYWSFATDDAALARWCREVLYR